MKKTIAIILLMIFLFCTFSNIVMAETGTITGSNVRMRRESNTSSDALQLVGKGMEVEILGEENGWYKVRYNGLTGYISSDYVEITSSDSPSSGGSSNSSNTTNTTGNASTNNEIENEPEPEPSNETNTNTAEVPAETTNETTGNEETTSSSDATEFSLSKEAELRLLPNFASAKVNTISEGTNVTVLDTLNKWVKITDGTNSGWVIRQNVEQSVTSTGNASQDDNSEVTVAVVESGETSSQSSSTTALPSDGTVNTDGSRLRDSVNGKVYTLLDINTPVEIIGKENDWYKVNVGEYTNAYISKSLVTVN